jgi:uncharacterized repeat protein (TIGR01451 family)
MRRLMDATNRAVKRVNVRLAGGAVAAIVCGVAIWQGTGYFRSAPAGPTKQVATGIDQTADPTGRVQPAVASLTDDQLPGQSTPGAFRQMQFTQPADNASAASPPATNPYLPTNNDPAGGYSSSRSTNSRYSGSLYGQYGDNAQPAAVPSDPTTGPPATEPVPENIYRPSPVENAANAASAPSTYPPLSQSPYATAATPSAGGYGAPATEAPPATARPADLTPPATSLPPADLSASPYASSAQPIRPLSLSAMSPAESNIGDLNPYRSSAPLPTDNGKRLSAATPGERQFEGPQEPAISLEKVSPQEIQVGKPATFALYVRNAGRAPAQNVVVTDHVPAGTQLVDARPQPQQSADGSLVWNLGAMQPGEETQITLQVMPQNEGELGSTAHVTFSATATSRSISTRPQLAIEHTAPPKVLIGEPLTVGITVSNPGTGPATGVIIEEDVPAGLSHVAGSQLEYEVGTLRPGESKHLDLSLRAERAGLVQNRIQVRGDANLAAQHAVQIEVVAPQLQLGVEGPKRRFLERQATYTMQVVNSGTAPARDIELAAFLPRGMKFVSTDSQGQYDPSQHAVLWSLAELPPSGKGAAKLTLMPVEPGEQKIQLEGRAALGLSAQGEQLVQVEQAAELVHSVRDLDEVIEVGSETTYEIRVTNTGTKAATNVRVAALMPAGMSAINGEGPTRAGGDATQIVFAPLERLNPQEEVIYKVQAQSRSAGDQIVRVQLSADDLPTVTREESTRVYQDR